MNSPLTEAPFGLPRQTSVLMVIDVVESVRLMEQDEDGFVDIWRQLVAHTEQALLPLHGGRIVKSLGDGLMLEFADAAGCIKVAFAMNAFCSQMAAERSVAPQLHLRAGVHLAAFVKDAHDIYGSDVNLTARLATLAGPAQIVVSAVVRDQLVANLDADIEDLGDCYLKHVQEPVHAYRVNPPGDIPVYRPLTADPTDLRPTVAVIPFTSRTHGEGDQVIGEILAEEIIVALSRRPDFNVISRLSTTALRGRDAEPADVQAHLRATYVLSGGYRVAGGRIALVAELADTRTNNAVWGESLRSSVDAVLHGEDEITSEIVRSIGSVIAQTEMRRAVSQPLPNLNSATLLMGAVSLMHRSTRTEFDRVRAMLEHLVDRHQRLPIPRAWLAKWHVLSVTRGLSPGGAHQASLALDQTRRALDNDPDCSLALTVEGFVHSHMLRDLDSAALRYESALSVNPNESLAWLFFGVLHSFRGNGTSALEASEKALTLSPLDPMLYYYQSLTASAALAAGQYERGIELATASLRANRSHTSTYRALAVAQALSGRLDDARKTVRALLMLEPEFTVRQFLQRSPTGNQPLGNVYAEALRAAGVPL